MSEIELYRNKARILELECNLQKRYIEQLKFYIQNGKQMLADYIKEDHFLEISGKHDEQLRVINLELENLELKRKLALREFADIVSKESGE